jgi:hypothetical protein
LTFNLYFGHNLCFKCPNGAHFRHLCFNRFSMIQKTLQIDGFWPLQSPSKNLEVHWVSNSQNGSSLGSVRVHSLTLFCTPGNIRCDSWDSFLAHNLANHCLCCEPKARVVTIWVQVWVLFIQYVRKFTNMSLSLDFCLETFEWKFEFDFLLQPSLSLAWSSCWSFRPNSTWFFFFQKKRKREGGNSIVGEVLVVQSLKSLNSLCLLLPLTNKNAQ